MTSYDLDILKDSICSDKNLKIFRAINIPGRIE